MELGHMEALQILLQLQHIPVVVGDDVVGIVGPADLILVVHPAGAGGAEVHGHPEEGLQEGVGPEIFPAVEAPPQVLLDPSGPGVPAEARERSVDIHLIPGDLLDQHRGTDDLQVVGRPDPGVGVLLLRGAGQFHISLRQLSDDLLILHGTTSCFYHYSMVFSWVQGTLCRKRIDKKRRRRYTYHIF